MSKAKNPNRAKQKREGNSIISNALRESSIYSTVIENEEIETHREIINLKTKKILQKNREKELVEN